MADYTVLHGGNQFGPHSADEIQSMLTAGLIDTTARIWHEDWIDWQPVAKLIPAKTGEQPTPVLSYTPKPKKQKLNLHSYHAKVGRRSFIFQIVLAVWTVSYCGWLLSVVASAESNSTPSSGTPFSRSAPSPLDLSAGLFSSWICFGLGWCIVGLPIGIAAVATLKHDDD